VLPQTEWANIAAGTEADFGLGFKFTPLNDLHVSFVYAQSSAGRQGVVRGWRVLSINGIAGNRDNRAAINAALSGSNIIVLFQKPDGSQQTLTLRAETYQTNPVLSSKVIPLGTQKVGYLVFNTFLGNTAVSELQTAINGFKSQGIQELVLDLRYNGGGDTRILESLANMIKPNNAIGQVMYRMQWNSKYGPRLNKTINFSNDPSGFNLSRMVIITTRSTASASEMLINSLRPYMNVTLLGENSVGKPIGFPVIPIQMSKTDPSKNFVVAPVAFKNVNARNEGDYFDGLPVDKIVEDDLTRDFGDPQEACLRQALSYFETGNLRIGYESGRMATPDPTLREANELLDHGRKGMFYQMP
jgi:C-terminal processing protease CtpA/Prc